MGEEINIFNPFRIQAVTQQRALFIYSASAPMTMPVLSAAPVVLLNLLKICANFLCRALKASHCCSLISMKVTSAIISIE
jgi:hypothetical protein